MLFDFLYFGFLDPPYVMVKMVKMSKNCKHFNFEAAAVHDEAASRQGLHFRIRLPIFGSFMVDAEL